jgi:hypothetical protein
MLASCVIEGQYGPSMKHVEWGALPFPPKFVDPHLAQFFSFPKMGRRVQNSRIVAFAYSITPRNGKDSRDDVRYTC